MPATGDRPGDATLAARPALRLWNQSIGECLVRIARPVAGASPVIRTPRLPRAATDDRDPASRAGRTRSAARRTVADEERRQRRRAAVAKSAVLATGLFDADWYLRTYRDVATTDFDPLDHYCRH